MTLRNRRCRALMLAAAWVMLGRGLDAAARSQPRTGSPEAQPTRADNPPFLEIRGEVPHPLSLSVADFAELPHRSVRARGHDGVESEFRGVPLAEILQRAGVPSGKDLRGPAMAL